MFIPPAIYWFTALTYSLSNQRCRVIAIYFKVSGDTFQYLCLGPLFFLPSSTKRGNPSSLKILFAYWHWWKAGNWVERRNTVQNKTHFQPRWEYTVSALVDSSSSLTNPLLHHFTHSRAHHFCLLFFSFSISLTFCLHHLLPLCACFPLFSPHLSLLPVSPSTHPDFFSPLLFHVVSVLPLSFLPSLYLGCWTSSPGASSLMAPSLVFNWCCLIETSCLLDSLRW